MGKQEKSNSGTILKVSSANFTKEELEDLWIIHNKTLQELDKPTQTYTRYTSELIKSLRDSTEKLILAGAITEVTSTKDTASYVWKKLQEHSIPYSRPAFYKLFDDTQKRDWQLGEDKEITKENHKHEFLLDGNIDGMGEVARCGAACIPRCTAMLIDGKLFEQQELQEKEPEPIPKPKTTFEIENEFFITPIQQVISRLQQCLFVWRTTSSNLTIDEIYELKRDFFYMVKAGEFLDMAYDRKNIIHPLIQHRLVLAYSEGTQKVAGGIFIKYRIDLAERKKLDGVAKLKLIAELKNYTKASQFTKFLSEKQTVKSMRGKTRKINPRYKPDTILQAMDDGFSGQYCSFCDGLMVGDDQVLNTKWKKGKPGWKEGDPIKDKPDPIHEKFDTKLICFECGKIQKREHFKLPKQIPHVVFDYNSTEESKEQKDDFIKFKKNNGFS